MESTAGRGICQGVSRGRAGDGDSTGHERPGVLWLRLQSGARNSHLRCVHTPLPLPCSRAGAGGVSSHLLLLPVLGLPEPQMQRLLTAVVEWAPNGARLLPRCVCGLCHHREQPAPHSPLCLPTTALSLLANLAEQVVCAPLLATLSWLILWHLAFAPSALVVFAR